ncbi:sugar ABC transporter permease [Amphibacillus sp. MSJ-3]|uniref:sugar ABC transporter permease n=1 Tax=Amphibacillus sp. MSJ-3 TaxID=2841505 RepID=UPI001C0E9852|nr:sugar ABC transporter permease [Amphibacillus sp. MSJ-3]MBU5594085.1 sugar ABC transporter permease [Amphibacillus sp. MSJ-3]
MSAKLKNTLELLGIYLIFGFMSIIILYPLAWAFGMSLNEGSSLYSSSIIPENWSLTHYQWLFTSPNSNYLNWYKNSMIVSGSNAILSVIITSLVAYAFSRYQFIGRKSGLYTFLILQMFPSMMAMVALYILLNLVGLLDSLIGLILIYVGGQIPFNAWLVKGYLDTIPRELDESARIDGAGHLTVFFKIIMPLAKPILAVVALFNFMTPLFDFLLPSIILHSQKNYTIALGLYQFINDQFSNNFVRFSAGAMLIAIPVAIIYLFLQKYLITGLTAGGTKG